MYFAWMWKKVLASLSIPVWLIVALIVVRAGAHAFTIHSLAAEGKSAGYLVGGYLGGGLVFALFGWLLFFWGRWIWRVLFKRKTPVHLEWPE